LAQVLKLRAAGVHTTRRAFLGRSGGMASQGRKLQIEIPESATPGMLMCIPMGGGSDDIELRIPPGLGAGSTIFLTKSDDSEDWDIEIGDFVPASPTLEDGAAPLCSMASDLNDQEACSAELVDVADRHDHFQQKPWVAQLAQDAEQQAAYAAKLAASAMTVEEVEFAIKVARAAQDAAQAATEGATALRSLLSTSASESGGGLYAAVGGLGSQCDTKQISCSGGVGGVDASRGTNFTDKDTGFGFGRGFPTIPPGRLLSREEVIFPSYAFEAQSPPPSFREQSHNTTSSVDFQVGSAVSGSTDFVVSDTIDRHMKLTQELQQHAEKQYGKQMQWLQEWMQQQQLQLLPQRGQPVTSNEQYATQNALHVTQQMSQQKLQQMPQLTPRQVVPRQKAQQAPWQMRRSKSGPVSQHVPKQVSEEPSQVTTQQIPFNMAQPVMQQTPRQTPTPKQQSIRTVAGGITDGNSSGTQQQLPVLKAKVLREYMKGEEDACHSFTNLNFDSMLAGA